MSQKTGQKVIQNDKIVPNILTNIVTDIDTDISNMDIYIRYESESLSIRSGGGDSGSRTGKRRGNIKGDNPRRRRQPQRDRDNNNNSSHINHTNSSTYSNGTNNDVYNNDTEDTRSTGWTLLSAGGCHYLDDGR